MRRSGSPTEYLRDGWDQPEHLWGAVRRDPAVNSEPNRPSSEEFEAEGLHNAGAWNSWRISSRSTGSAAGRFTTQAERHP